MVSNVSKPCFSLSFKQGKLRELPPPLFLSSYAQIAVMLLENGADPDATDHFESTPLHRAAAKGNLKMIQILLRYNASVNMQDSEGNTPL